MEKSVMECHFSSCRCCKNDVCTDKENYIICHQVISQVQGNTEGCELCKEIYSARKYPEDDHIAKNSRGKYDLFSFIGSSNEFAMIKNIRYCPKCGRKLNYDTSIFERKKEINS